MLLAGLTKRAGGGPFPAHFPCPPVPSWAGAWNTPKFLPWFLPIRRPRLGSAHCCLAHKFRPSLSSLRGITRRALPLRRHFAHCRCHLRFASPLPPTCTNDATSPRQCGPLRGCPVLALQAAQRALCVGVSLLKGALVGTRTNRAFTLERPAARGFVSASPGPP